MEVAVAFIAGTDIKDAIEEAKYKANQWNVAYVSFGFNGRRLSISQNADIEKALEEWRNKKNESVIA